MRKSARYRIATAAHGLAVLAALTCVAWSIAILPGRAETQKREYLLAEIFVPFERPEDEAAARQQAEEAMIEANNTGNFSAVAKKVSQAPSAALGGAIGWWTNERLRPELRRALRWLPVGQMTEPVRTNDGFYLLYLRDRKGPEPSPDEPPETTLPAGQIRLVQVNVRILSKTDRSTQAALRIAQQLRNEIKRCESAKNTVGPMAEVKDLGVLSLTALPEQLRETLPKLPNNSSGPAELSPEGFASFYVVCDGGTGPVD